MRRERRRLREQDGAPRPESRSLGAQMARVVATTPGSPTDVETTAATVLGVDSKAAPSLIKGKTYRLVVHAAHTAFGHRKLLATLTFRRLALTPTSPFIALLTPLGSSHLRLPGQGAEGGGVGEGTREEFFKAGRGGGLLFVTSLLLRASPGGGGGLIIIFFFLKGGGGGSRLL